MGAARGRAGPRQRGAGTCTSSWSAAAAPAPRSPPAWPRRAIRLLSSTATTTPSGGCLTTSAVPPSSGPAIDHGVLEAAGVARADVLVAATYGDNSNLTAVQLARLKYHVPRAIARVKDPVRARVFAEQGIETICSTDIIAGAVIDRLANAPAV